MSPAFLASGLAGEDDLPDARGLDNGCQAVWTHGHSFLISSRGYRWDIAISLYLPAQAVIHY